MIVRIKIQQIALSSDVTFTKEDYKLEEPWQQLIIFLVDKILQNIFIYIHLEGARLKVDEPQYDHNNLDKSQKTDWRLPQHEDPYLVAVQNHH